jgi:3-phosphoshikimate 1-carboxyvinyltransferase
MMAVKISHPTKIVQAEIVLPSSKSESNRLLILQALSDGKIKIQNLSKANDTKLLREALASHEVEINVQDAGTSIRFLTAYFCATNQHKILTGTQRMKERPIGILVDALREIGFQINYLEKEGFVPLEIISQKNLITKKEVSIIGNISSQYISALLMIAPHLPNGLTMHFTTAISSKPYIELTLSLMKACGIEHKWNENTISILPQRYKACEQTVSADWSAASYWYEIAALSKEANILLKELSFKSIQGDKVIAEFMKPFGVHSEEKKEGVLISKEKPKETHALVNFSNSPDLAQTFIVTAAAKNTSFAFTGLESLRIKETDRIQALQKELEKFNVALKENEKGAFEIEGNFQFSKDPIQTYHDHRMAMAFAPLALLNEITINNPEVVEKSYPSFWDDLKKAGFVIR